jgi:hypothetical protein
MDKAAGTELNVVTTSHQQLLMIAFSTLVRGRISASTKKAYIHQSSLSPKNVKDMRWRSASQHSEQKIVGSIPAMV